MSQFSVFVKDIILIFELKVITTVLNLYNILIPAVPHADSAAVGIIFTCVAFLLLIALIVTGYHSIRKQDSVKKGVPVTQLTVSY